MKSIKKSIKEAHAGKWLDFDEVIEVISKLGFWFHIKAAAKFKPEEYVGISMT